MTLQRFRNLCVTLAVGCVLAAAGTASAAPVSITVNGAFTHGTGTLSFLQGLGYTSTFAYDPAGATINNEFADPATGGTGQEIGTEFTGGSATPLIPFTGDTYTSPTLIAEMENNVTRTPAELLNLLPGGTYDFFTINGWHPQSIFSGGSTIHDSGAVEGLNFGLGFIGDGPSALIGPLTASDPMPSALDLGLVDNVVVVVEEYEGEELVGLAYQFGTIGAGGTFENFAIVSDAAVAEPAALGVFGVGLLAAGLFRRRR